MEHDDKIMKALEDCIFTLTANARSQNKRMERLEQLFETVIRQNSELLSAADARLKCANDMVLNLSNCIHGMEELNSNIDKKYIDHIDQACKSRDAALAENIEMRKELTQLRKELMSTVAELARRPVISNSNS